MEDTVAVPETGETRVSEYACRLPTEEEFQMEYMCIPLVHITTSPSIGMAAKMILSDPLTGSRHETFTLAHWRRASFGSLKCA